MRLVTGDRAVDWVVGMAFFMVLLLGWSWGAGLWLVFAKSEGGDAVLVRVVDMDGAVLSGKGNCCGRGYTPCLLRLHVMNGSFTMNPRCSNL